VISVNKTAGRAVIMYTIWSIGKEQSKLILDHKHSSPGPSTASGGEDLDHAKAGLLPTVCRMISFFCMLFKELFQLAMLPPAIVCHDPMLRI
jgi:hypothetical protein